MTDEKDLEQPIDGQEPDNSGSVDASSGAADDIGAEVSEEAPQAKPSSDSAVAVEEKPEAEASDEDKIINDGDESEDDAEAAMLAMLEDLPDDDGAASVEDINFGNAEVSEAEFQQLSQPAGGADPSNINMLMDVDLPVAIELGRTEMSINDILALGAGSVVELNKLAGEPVDLLVNSKVVARGEVVVVDENFGLRITHLLTPEERLKSLASS